MELLSSVWRLRRTELSYLFFKKSRSGSPNRTRKVIILVPIGHCHWIDKFVFFLICWTISINLSQIYITFRTHHSTKLMKHLHYAKSVKTRRICNAHNSEFKMKNPNNSHSITKKKPNNNHSITCPPLPYPIGIG